MNITRIIIPSSKFSVWRAEWGESPAKRAFIIHCTEGSSLDSMRWTFMNTLSASSRIASAQYGIGRDGTIEQYVDDNDIAYHVGEATLYRPAYLDNVPSGLPFSDVNAVTIGIELVGYSSISDGFTAKQYLGLATLIENVAPRHGIVLFEPDGTLKKDVMLGHMNVQSGNSDPGVYFSWQLNEYLLRSLVWLKILQRDRDINFARKMDFESFGQDALGLLLGVKNVLFGREQEIDVLHSRFLSIRQGG